MMLIGEMTGCHEGSDQMDDTDMNEFRAFIRGLHLDELNLASNTWRATRGADSFTPQMSEAIHQERAQRKAALDRRLPPDPSASDRPMSLTELSALRGD